MFQELEKKLNDIAEDTRKAREDASFARSYSRCIMDGSYYPLVLLAINLIVSVTAIGCCVATLVKLYS